jgi:hypothetical protein
MGARDQDQETRPGWGGATAGCSRAGHAGRVGGQEIGGSGGVGSLWKAGSRRLLRLAWPVSL